MDFILNNFNMLFDSEKNLKKLEEIILDLAVSGKLVSQDPLDEPASALLKKIEEEKQRLISEKKIKKPKVLEVITEEEKNFDIPESWEWVRLGALSTIRGGKRIPKGMSLTEEVTPHVYIRVTDMKNNSVNDFNLRYIKEQVFEKIKNYIIEKDDLYITIAGTIGDVGEIPEKFHGMNLTENAGRITPYFLNKTFLMYFLNSGFIQSQFKEMVNQMAQPKLALTRIATTVLPLPPLAEQKRIVKRIDSLKGIIESLKKEIQTREKTREGLKKSIMAEIEKSSDDQELLKNLELIFQNFDIVVKKKEDIKDIRDLVLSMAVKGKLVPQESSDEPASVLLEKIEDEKARLIAEKKIKKPKKLALISEEEKPFDLPESWEWVRFENLSKVVEYGTSSKAHEIKLGVPVLRMGNVQNGKVDFNNLKYVSEDIKDLPRLYLNYGDIIFNRTNSYELVGKTAVFEEKDMACTLASYLIRIEMFMEFISTKYINLVMNSNVYRRTQIEPGIVQQNNQANYNGTKLKNTCIPLPPLAEQKRIVERVDKLMELCDRLEEQVEKSQRKMEVLMGSVMQLGSL